MMLTDRIKKIGEVEIFTRKKGTEEWNLQRSIKNLTVNQGLDLIRDHLFASETRTVSQGAVSDDLSAPAAGDTELGGNEVRKSFTSTLNSINFQSTVEYFIDGTDWASATPSAITSVTKVGLYFAASGTTLFTEASFAGIAVDSDTEMLVAWTVIFSDA